MSVLTIVDKLVGTGLREIQNGYACEVGAADGNVMSQTRDLEDLGWAVLCIEPNPLYWGTLSRARKLAMPYACGAGNRELVEFHSFEHIDETVGMNYMAGSGLRYDFDVLDGVGGAHCRTAPHETFRVPMRTLDWCLEQAAFPRLDALSIDAEGYEDEILKGFDVQHWKPRLISIENWGAKMATVNWFSDRGYVRCAREGVNDYYIPAE